MGFTKNNITFTSFPTGNITNSAYPPANDPLTKVAAGKASSFILQSVLIDWNGAQLPNADPTTGSTITLNRTEDLLNLINEMQKEIYTLTAAVIALSNK